MIQICANPGVWHDAHTRLTAYAQLHPCLPPDPPKPLILAGWAHSNDREKLQRWKETVAWAARNGCLEIIMLPATDFYCAEVDQLTSYVVGPLGGPVYRPWDFETKERPSPEQLSRHLATLTTRWKDIVGAELASATKPLEFSGTKGRRLLVQADPIVDPPWGNWAHLSPIESERRAFTRFRASINSAIAPHEVDHIDFTSVPRTGDSSGA